MRNALIEQFEKRVFSSTKTHPRFRAGDTLKVHYKIEESAKGAKGEKKYRIQVFEGVCIRFKNKSGVANATFTVRKIGANSVGVERIFPIHSPYIEKIELVSGGKVRRGRLYYLRGLSGKAARIKTRRLPADTVMQTVDSASQPSSGKKSKK